MNFGIEARALFEFEPGYTCINHCSHGQCPKEVHDFKRQLYNRIVGNPDRFYKFEYVPLLNKSRAMVAEFIRADVPQVFLVTNSTEAMNSIMRSIHWKPADLIVYTNLSYHMVKPQMQYLTDYFGVTSHEIAFTHEELSKEIIIQKHRDVFDKLKPTAVLLEFITCFPSFVYPTKELIQLCREYNVISIVDAAHGIGIIDLNLTELDPDFFFTNPHKWLMTPTPCGLLYASKKYQDALHSSTISMNYGKGSEKEFEYHGTQDKSNFVCIQAGLKFIQKLGLENVISYCYDLAWEAANLMAKVWGTRTMFKDKAMQTALAMVEVPSKNLELVRKCQEKCVLDHNFFLVCEFFDGIIWARISASIYNVLDDYNFAAKWFLEELKQAN